MVTKEGRRGLYGGKTEPDKKVRLGAWVRHNHRLVAKALLGRHLAAE